ncbi:MAG: hypothetical protein AB1589_13700 [Cyanobacteriota bacterium]
MALLILRAYRLKRLSAIASIQNPHRHYRHDVGAGLAIDFESNR